MQRDSRESLFTLLVIALVLIMLISALPAAPSRAEEKAQLMPLEAGWYYIKEGVETPVELPANISCGAGETLVLCNDSLTQDAAGLVLTTRGVQNGLKATMNGELLYEYSDEDFPRNSQMKSKYDCDIPLPADIKVGTLEITYVPTASGNYSLSKFYIGNGSAVMWSHFANNAVPIVIAFSFILLSIIAIGIAIYLHFSRIDKKRFVDTAIFLLICSAWVITDTSLMQIQSGNAAAVCTVSFFSFMLLAVPMLYFIKHTSGMEKYGVLDWLIRLFNLNAIVQGLLHHLLHIEFRDMLVVTHILLTIGVGISVFLLVKEYRQTKTRDIARILFAFALLGFSGVLAMALYWLLNIPFYGTIFEIGICAFVIFLIDNIVTIMAENLNYRTEMQVYQRLLREDGMTGMESRRPFNDYLAEVQKNPVNHKSASLVSFKVNHLKNTQEQSWHAAGDELILGAAKCISETFGDAGRCYRLDDDEFCVILEEPQMTKDEWFQRFDLAIQKFNRNNRYRLSIAKGWSDFCNEDGSLKSVNDWAYGVNKNLF